VTAGRALTVAFLASIFLAVPTSPAAPEDPRPIVDVIKVKGLIDPALSGFVRGAMQAAERRGVAIIVLQIDSLGGYGHEAERLGAFVAASKVPVVAWIAPAGARTEDGALFVLYSSSLAVMAPGAGIGPARPFDVGTSPSRERPEDVALRATRLTELATRAGATAAGVQALLRRPSLPAGPALDAGAVAVVASDVCDLLEKVDGRSVRTASGMVVLSTAGCPSGVLVEFDGMGPVRRALHAVSTPTAVYVLLILGLWAIAFELTQPAFGVAGAAGAVFLAFAGYGLSVIPVHWAGLALILGGTALQGLDVVVRRVAWLTALGTASIASGSVLAWRGVGSAIDLALWLIVLATLGGLLFFGFGMTVALKARERIRTTQVGLVGLVGDVRSDLNPEGGVYVKGAIWRARSTDGFIPKGTRVRVKGIDGLILRVEEEPE
jgi:membrane-bound serine protease (ClpP class)